MVAGKESFADKILRNYCRLFSAREMQGVLAAVGTRASLKEVVQYLEASPLVFPLEDGMYITRAGAFTGELFSIKPSVQEWEQGVLVPGSRCVPFVDMEMLSSSLTFFFDGKPLPSRTGVFDSDLAVDMFLLFGEEYAPQYIAADPANEPLGLGAVDFELPLKVKLTGIDISIFKERFGFRKGDRFLCSVRDWDKGFIDISVVHDGGSRFELGEEGAQRLDWYRRLDDYLEESFDVIGPCSSMEEQLANVFFEHTKELCVRSCGSIDEFIGKYSKLVGIEEFGVETRLWRSGQQVPAVGSWNLGDLNSLCSSTTAYGYSVPEYILDQYVLGMLYKRQSDVEALVASIIPDNVVVDKSLSQYLLLHLRERSAILSKEYNWFADQSLGPVREKALELYSRVAALVYRVDCVGKNLVSLPQQELVILSQLYSHVCRILQAVSENDHIEEDFNSLLASLDGMGWNFEDVSSVLEESLRKQQKKRFTVIS